MRKTRMIMCVIMLAVIGGAMYAQTAPRSYYVRADGSDDNNGRSEDTPFKTIKKAVEAAQMGVIKRITVIGTITEQRIYIQKAGDDEILITGKENAADAEKAVISGYISIEASKIRFTHIKLDLSNNIGYGMAVSGSVTLDVNTLVVSEKKRGAPTMINVDAGNLTMTGNAAITGYNVKSYSRNEKTLIMSGSAKISGSKDDGISSITRVIMSDNAEISGNKEDGISHCGLVTMSGGARVVNNGQIGINNTTGVTMSGMSKVSGNGGAGIARTSDVALSENAEVSDNGKLGILASKITISGNVKVSGNKGVGVRIEQGAFTMNGGAISANEGKNGGGVFIDDGGTAEISGGVISGNKAEYGAGVYVNSGSFTFKGGSITANDADFVGGGVYVRTGAAYTAGAGTVTDNTAGDGGANVFRQQGGSAAVKEFYDK